MKTNFLLLALSVAVFSSCSTIYKSGQTPDDVYYSPVKIVEEQPDNYRDQERYEPSADYGIRMGVRDRRWRNYSDDYDFRNSPYNYATCNTYNYGYYYNPYYYPWAIYAGKVIYAQPNNTAVRMVNLNAYKGYNSNIASIKTTGTNNNINPSSRYNNNNNRSTIGNAIRQAIAPGNNSSSNNNNNNSNNNNTRSYTPSSNSSSPSSGGRSSGTSVSRPGRGG